MTQTKTTHDAIAETLVRPYTEPIHTTHETTHDLQVSRYVQQFHADPTVAQLADVLSTATDSKRDAVKAALAGETKQK